MPPPRRRGRPEPGAVDGDGCHRGAGKDRRGEGWKGGRPGDGEGRETFSAAAPVALPIGERVFCYGNICVVM